MRERGSPRGMVPVAGVLDTTYNEYLDGIGIRDPERAPVVEFALASSNDVRFREFLNKLKHPFWSSSNNRRGKPASLAALAKACDISLPQWAEFWQKAQHQRALALAQGGIVDHVIPDMVEDAKSKQISCDRCDGFGFVYADDVPAKFDGIERLDPRDPKSRQIRACPLCKGKGTVLKSGDTDSRKLLLEVSGLTNKKGSAVQITQHFGGMGMESAVDRLNKVTFDLSDAIDVEAVPAGGDNSNSES